MTTEEMLNNQDLFEFLSYVCRQSSRLATRAEIDITRLHLSCTDRHYSDELQEKVESKKDVLRVLAKLKKLASNLKKEIEITTAGEEENDKTNDNN